MRSHLIETIVTLSPFSRGSHLAIRESISESCMNLVKKSVRVVHHLSGHNSRDWSEYVNVIGVIRELFAVNEDSE